MYPHAYKQSNNPRVKICLQCGKHKETALHVDTTNLKSLDIKSMPDTKQSLAGSALQMTLGMRLGGIDARTAQSGE
jgi:hypothetical protein